MVLGKKKRRRNVNVDLDASESILALLVQHRQMWPMHIEINKQLIVLYFMIAFNVKLPPFS